jgi:hypothetical protein
LLGAGGLVFFFGDRALHEFWKVNFGLAELTGIGCGLALILGGAAMQMALPESERIQAKKRHG